MFKIISLIIITLFLIPVSSEVKLSDTNIVTPNNIYLLLSILMYFPTSVNSQYE